MSPTLRNNFLDEITALAGTSATIKLYTGTQPGGGGTVTTLLGTYTCDVQAFAGNAAAGVLTLNGVTGSIAVATGTSTWFRLESSGSVFVFDGDISTVSQGTGDMLLNDTSIVQGGTLSLSGTNTITAPNAA